MSNSSSITFPGLLTIVFVTLKLIGKIAWSWWWVVSPIWIVILIALFMAIIEAINEEG